MSLEEIGKDLEKKKEKYIEAKEKYEAAWIQEKFGQYIGQYTKFSVCHGAIPQYTYYLYVNSIEFSKKYTNYIRISGTVIRDKTWKRCDTEEIMSKEFMFSTMFSTEADFEDVEFEVISKEEWMKEYGKYIKGLNKYVKSL